MSEQRTEFVAAPDALVANAGEDGQRAGEIERILRGSPEHRDPEAAAASAG